jgi:hypothetical protein
MNIWRYFVGLGHRLAYATTLGLLTWYLYMMPCPALDMDLRRVIVAILDLPVAIVSQVLPGSWWKGIDVFSVNPFGHGLAPELVLVRHLRLAIPVYVLLFYLASLCRLAGYRFRKSRAAMDPTPFPPGDPTRDTHVQP